jgi:hypothetical protein
MNRLTKNVKKRVRKKAIRKQRNHKAPAYLLFVFTNPAKAGFTLYMALGAAILKIVSKQYEPSAFVEKKFMRYDLGFKTDTEGNPIVLFMGTKDATGHIRGRRYARRLVKDENGKIIKDHWDDKGPIS